jgi:hypothetical protein
VPAAAAGSFRCGPVGSRTAGGRQEIFDLAGIYVYTFFLVAVGGCRGGRRALWSGGGGAGGAGKSKRKRKSKKPTNGD